MFKRDSLVWYGGISLIFAAANITFQFLYDKVQLIDVILLIVGILFFMVGLISVDDENI